MANEFKKCMGDVRGFLIAAPCFLAYLGVITGLSLYQEGKRRIWELRNILYAEEIDDCGFGFFTYERTDK